MQLQQLTRKVRQEFQVLFGSGLRSPDVNHLFGTRRRYNAAELVNQEIYQVVLSNPVIREQLNRNLPVMREMVLVCGVVDDQLRVNAYRVSNEDIWQHPVGGDHAYSSGLCSILVSRNDNRDEPMSRHTASIQLLRRPVRGKRYNIHDPEFSWSCSVDDLPSGLIQNQFYEKEEV